MISVCVASDSTNHPVRNSTGPACSTPSINPNVRKSNSELIGPNVSMNRRMNAMFQCDGCVQLLAVHPVGGDRQLGAVVEQVVQQDLAGQHRQKR